MLCLEYPADLRGLSQLGTPNDGPQIAATFTVAQVPSGTNSIEDSIYEDFDDREFRENDLTQIKVGQTPASWDEHNSNILQAALAVREGGLLGRLEPAAPAAGDTRTIFFDTNTMTFPMLDGSTPDAPPNTTIIGGSFPFTEIDIPVGIRIQCVGSNPLILLATGSVRIAGEIHAQGADGTNENSYDSATTPIPGGNGVAGGGRGGESHPPFFFPPTQPTLRNLVSPPFAGDGWGSGNAGRTGGKGGQCGMWDNPDVNTGEFGTDKEISCSEVTDSHNNVFSNNPQTGNNYPKGYKPPGGGGGSFLTSGTTSNVKGRGNIITDGQGSYFEHVGNLAQGPPGPTPFSDGDTSNDYIGFTGELQEPLAGQGGGAGGSALDSYYCGGWCRHDLDPSNDVICSPEAPAFADSIGDSRGGSGAAGGGAIVIEALGSVVVTASGRIFCQGGTGGGGEALGCSNWAGAGASGSGGAILIQSGDGIEIRNGALLDVRGGPWVLARKRPDYITSCGSLARGNTPAGDIRGDAGRGGDGLIQLQVPSGERADVVSPLGVQPFTSWVDQQNRNNPSEFSPTSVALSSWFDFGRAIDRPPTGTNPVFEFLVNGVPAADLPQNQNPADPNFAVVPTNVNGFIEDPEHTDIVCDYLGQTDPITGLYVRGEEPKSNHIPMNATVKVEFQAADALSPGSKEVDLTNLSSWSPTPNIGNGRQFLRYRITFDITADGSGLGPSTRLPAVQSLRVRARF
jgi:hypothetical protein